MHWAVLSLLIVGAIASPVDEEKAVAPVAADPATRDGKLFSVFQIVKFNNDACDAIDGTLGTCYTASECTEKGGEERGNCASGFGVCCVAVVDPCGTSSLALNNSYIVNPGFPNDVSSPGAADCSTPGAGVTRQIADGQTYTWSIKKAASDIVQLRFDFIYFETSPPMMGDCTNDTFVITGADPVSMKVLPTNLCGLLTGQHLYVDIKDSEEVTVTLALATIGTQKFQILVRQFDSSQTDYLAPRGCLQYFREDAGTISTFNNNGGDGELLNNHLYSTCIAQNDAYCDISLTASNFELTGSSGACSDAVVFGLSQQCGATFGVDGSLLWNYTGSYMIPFQSDADNTAMVTGFEISFILLPC